MAKMKDYDTSKAKALKARIEKKEKPVASVNKEVRGSVKDAPTRTFPKKYGDGDEKLRNDKANVSAAQLKASGLSLRSYMNQWNKTGKRPGSK